MRVGALGSPPPPEPTTEETTPTTIGAETPSTTAANAPTTTTQPASPPRTTDTVTTVNNATDHPDVRGLELVTGPDGMPKPGEPKAPDRIGGLRPEGELAATGGALHPERGILVGVGAALARMLLKRSGDVSHHKSDGVGGGSGPESDAP